MENNDLRQCTKCKIYKNKCEFSKNFKGKDGLRSWCKKCIKENLPVRIIGKCKCGCGRDLIVNGFVKIKYIKGHDKLLPRRNCLECGVVLNLKNMTNYCKLHFHSHKSNSLPSSMTEEERKSRIKIQVRNSRLMLEYGITIEDYNNMLREQNYKCYLCGREHVDSLDGQKKLVIDHCHETGKVRKLLCKKCNTTLGLFENEATKNKFLNYIKEFEDVEEIGVNTNNK